MAKDAHKHLMTGSEPPKFQGGEKLYEAMSENPKWAEALEKEVNAIAGTLTESE